MLRFPSPFLLSVYLVVYVTVSVAVSVTVSVAVSVTVSVAVSATHTFPHTLFALNVVLPNCHVSLSFALVCCCPHSVTAEGEQHE